MVLYTRETRIHIQENCMNENIKDESDGINEVFPQDKNCRHFLIVGANELFLAFGIVNFVS
jgi:hypothetical protein